MADKKTIHLGNALEVIHSGEPFSMEFVTCDVNRKKGGEWVKALECIKVFSNKFEDPQINPEAVHSTRLKRNASWGAYDKATIFIQIIKSDNDRFPPGFKLSVHIDLIMVFNGLPILLAPKVQAA